MRQALSALSPSAKILAGVRDPTSAKSADLKAVPNVTLVQADLSKPETLAKAIPSGVDAVYVNVPGDEHRTQQAINGIHAAKNAKVRSGFLYPAFAHIAHADRPVLCG
jgi:uncharacterized protein YbjT (DUF2867 family)